MAPRFVLRPDAQGFSVIDIWSGQAAELAMTRQVGLSEADAEHVAELLNGRAVATTGTAPSRQSAET